MEQIRDNVLAVVAEVPAGRVTTYGAIAEAVECGPRQVAAVLANDPEAADVPWHRVVAAQGRLSIPRPEDNAEQVRRLQAEGVTVTNGRVARFSTVFYAP